MSNPLSTPRLSSLLRCLRTAHGWNLGSHIAPFRLRQHDVAGVHLRAERAGVAHAAAVHAAPRLCWLGRPIQARIYLLPTLE